MLQSHTHLRLDHPVPFVTLLAKQTSLNQIALDTYFTGAAKRTAHPSIHSGKAQRKPRRDRVTA